MGWTVLYIAFGIVALWLLGEVLLQYKARLRWRLLAFTGFLGVVVGVLIPSVVVIGLGAAAFAVGQTYVTLSFRRGFAAGWAVNAPMLAAAKGRRGDRGRQEPTLEVSDLEASGGGRGDEDADHHGGRTGYGTDDDYDSDDVFTPAHPGRPTADGATAVYEPQPLPDDTGSYGVYGDTGYSAPSQAPYEATAQGADQGYAYDYSGYGQQGYDTTGQQQYAAYPDPYAGTPDLRRRSPVRHRLRRPAAVRPAALRPGPVRRRLRRRDPVRRPVGPAAAHHRRPVRRRTPAGAAVPVPGRRAQAPGNGYDEQYRF
ncbi:hypothetical protein GCM10019016_029020 [Streptomyces prasinosporus]|uniref:Uncharacterized protein n=1 Tax=Streptomyces prasinosporus TaxID=68256 RepID=A0ABP6TKN2_9ACTN